MVWLTSAHLHPLALVSLFLFTIWKKDRGLFIDEAEEACKSTSIAPLREFEHFFKVIVDFIVFFFLYKRICFVLCGHHNMGYSCFFNHRQNVWNCFLFSCWNQGWVSSSNRMKLEHLVVTSIIAGIGFTVALFVAGEAYNGNTLPYQGSAKMGALFSIFGLLLAWGAAKCFGIKRKKHPKPSLRTTHSKKYFFSSKFSLPLTRNPELNLCTDEKCSSFERS